MRILLLLAGLASFEHNGTKMKVSSPFEWVFGDMILCIISPYPDLETAYITLEQLLRK